MQPEASPYVAPARYVLTVLHRQDPSATAGRDAEGEPVTGWTVCGLAMGESELWVPVDSRDGDQMCTRCMMPGSAKIAAMREPDGLLW